MDKLIIRGGRSLSGTVQVSGAKNAALPLMVASLLTDQALRLHHAPRLADIRTIAKLLRHLGVSVEGDGEPTICLRADGVHRWEAPYELVKTMRASVLVLGPLLARFGRARVSLPGGCAIGPRPINLHLAGLQKLGAEVTLSGGYVETKASRLRGARIRFDIPTVTGTENLMMAAALAEGTTVLENAACEPEVLDLAGLLTAMGAEIQGAGSPTVVVHGVRELRGGERRIIPDRIEAGTFAVAAAITQGDVLIRGCVPGHLGAVTAKLREAGATVEERPDGLRVALRGCPRAASVETGVYPGFATDMQAQFMALMCVAEGRSVITETIFEKRFMHVPELLRMGAEIRVAGNTATVQGVAALSGAPVMATDLRASASLVVAGLVGHGETAVSRIYHLDRGYEALEVKLRGLGADIERVPG